MVWSWHSWSQIIHPTPTARRIRSRRPWRLSQNARTLTGRPASFANNLTRWSSIRANEQLHPGVKSTFDDVEALGKQLLKDYTAPEERGLIYYQLAHTHGQSGISNKERAVKVVEYAQNGLACPLDPDRTLQLYMYLGSALQYSDSSKSWPDRRLAAARVLLEGLKEAQSYNIPDAPPRPAGRRAC